MGHGIPLGCKRIVSARQNLLLINAGRLMHLGHGRLDLRKHIAPLAVQQCVIAVLDRLHPGGQLADLAIRLRHLENSAHLAQLVRELALRLQILPLPIQAADQISGAVEDCPLGLEEGLHFGNVFIQIQQLVLHGDELFEQGCVVFLLGQQGIQRLDAVFNSILIRIGVAVVLQQQCVQIIPLPGKAVDHKCDQPILIRGDVHEVKVVTQEFP